MSEPRFEIVEELYRVANNPNKTAIIRKLIKMPSGKLIAVKRWIIELPERLWTKKEIAAYLEGQ